ncbi:damage-inducible protein CinA [Aliidiomarina iranensis]|uniref:Damage-inducible protein CinA n=1 Tax=Aliidiomarina iranensis TaxID=1434071 RepID=A0A432W0F7_9GAMM|nr:CinA family protein [Aliidiomarina iranensis]RUO22496.1 damage-inducible protein CinA [Aliidiomarina iranensis]
MIANSALKSSVHELVKKLSEQLLNKGYRLATAESCTGGGIAAHCTDLAGSSAWFEGAIVSYSNAMKMNLLGVSANILEEHGAVSKECAAAMVSGLCSRLHTEVGISVTGVAGPTGGSKEKPVGMVCFGFAVDNKTWTDIQYFSGDRAQVRAQSVHHALTKLIEYLE